MSVDRTGTWVAKVAAILLGIVTLYGVFFQSWYWDGEAQIPIHPNMAQTQSKTCGPSITESGLCNIKPGYHGIHQYYNDNIIGNAFSYFGISFQIVASSLLASWYEDTFVP